MPSAVWVRGRRARRVVRVLSILLGATILALLVRQLVGSYRVASRALDSRLQWCAIIIIALAWAGVVWALSHWMHSTHKYLQANERRVCMQCGCSLKSLPLVHTCPHCATPFDADALAETWQCWIRDARDRGLLPDDVAGRKRTALPLWAMVLSLLLAGVNTLTHWPDKQSTTRDIDAFAVSGLFLAVFGVLAVVQIVGAIRRPDSHRVKRGRRLRNCCEECGYPRAGLPSDRCPECGHVNDW